MPLTGRAFLPEVPAYVEAFNAAGHEPVVVEAGQPVSASRQDVVVRFGGVIRADASRKYTEIHEYHNVSRRSFPRSRNLVKRAAAGRPDGRIFVTEWVRDELGFSSRIGSIVRDQGAAPDLLTVRGANERKYDVVYCGSVQGRPGLVDAIARLSSLGFSVGVAGSASAAEARALGELAGVTYVGSIPHEQVPEFLGAGRLGLHYCPDRYPFRYEFGTKVVEYLVAGLPVISNRYAWIDDHSAREGYSYLDLASIDGPDDLSLPETAMMPIDRARSLTWPQVLRRADVVGFVERIAGG